MQIEKIKQCNRAKCSNYKIIRKQNAKNKGRDIVSALVHQTTFSIKMINPNALSTWIMWFGLSLFYRSDWIWTSGHYFNFKRPLVHIAGHLLLQAIKKQEASKDASLASLYCFWLSVDDNQIEAQRKWVWFGKEEQRHERTLTFKKKSEQAI